MAKKLDPLDRPAWRGRTNVDALTIAVIELAEKLGGHEHVITQGSYQSTVKQSGGTHDRGGAVDLRWCGHQRCIEALRQSGAWAWHRTPAEGDWPHHIHLVVNGHPDLSPSAARQVVAGKKGLNALVSGRPDTGPRVPVPTPSLPWPRVTRGAHVDDAIEHTTEALQQVAVSVKVAKAKGQKARLAKLRVTQTSLRTGRAALRSLPVTPTPNIPGKNAKVIAQAKKVEKK